MLLQVFKCNQKVINDSIQRNLSKVHVPFLASGLYVSGFNEVSIISLENNILSNDSTLKSLLGELSSSIKAKLAKLLVLADFVFTTIVISTLYRVINQAASVFREEYETAQRLQCLQKSLVKNYKKLTQLMLSEVKVLTSELAENLDDVIYTQYNQVATNSFYSELFTKSSKLLKLEKVLPRTFTALCEGDPSACSGIKLTTFYARKFFRKFPVQQIELIDVLNFPFYYQLKSCMKKQATLEDIVGELSSFQKTTSFLSDTLSSLVPELVCIFMSECLVE